jgi:hypothetical protein
MPKELLNDHVLIWDPVMIPSSYQLMIHLTRYENVIEN